MPKRWKHLSAHRRLAHPVRFSRWWPHLIAIGVRHTYFASTLTSITTTVPAALCPTAHSTWLKRKLTGASFSVSLASTGPCHYLTLPETKHQPRREKHPDKLTRRVSIFSRLVGIDRPARPGLEEWRTRDVLRHGRRRLVSPESIDPVAPVWEPGS